jgi:DNA-binding SARP family transcriptional activator
MHAPNLDSSGMPPSPRIVTLGAFTLISSTLHSANPVLGPGKPLALLLYLHSSPSRRASREHLSDLLWADLDPAAARHALRQTLWYLRQRMGAASIRTDNGDVVLALEVTCDRDDFVRSVAEGRAEDAVRIYQGHFLPDFAVPGGLEFEHWTDAERTRLRLMFLRTAESVVRTRLSSGHAREARELARRVRDGNDQSEASWRLYLEALVAGHDTVTALTEVERLLEMLRQEGRAPEPATRALIRTIQQEPEPASAPATGLVAELVGRERQFAAIVEAWEGIRDGHAVHVQVSAPAGMGKTRLLLDVAARLGAAGGRCVYVRANPGEHAVPFALAAELTARLAELSGAKGVSPGSAGALVAMNPAVSSTYSQPADTAGGDEAMRRRTLALAELVRVLADDAPIAVLVDDIHWADPTSRRLFGAVFEKVSGERVLAVSATRPVSGVEPAPQALRIELPPLTPEQLTALLSSIGELSGDLAQDLPPLVFEASEGSPLLALESLQAAIDEGLLELDNGTWHSPTPKALAARLTRGSALRERVAALERGQHWLLVLLASGGLPLGTETLAAAAGRPVDAVGADLFELERRGLAQRADDLWVPAHDAIAEAATAATTDDALHAAGANLGNALARDPHAPKHLVARAAQLLALSDAAALRTLFRRWVQTRRRLGDRRRPVALAAELLGDTAPTQVYALARSVPLHVRLGIDTPGRVAAAVIPLLALAVAGYGVLERPHPAPPDAVLVAVSNAPGTHGTWRAELRRDAWDPRFDIQLRPTRRSLARVLGEARSGSAIAAGLDAQSWIVEHVFADSGGMDLVQVFTDGRASRRLTSTPGDDGAASAASWAPDGSAIAFTTARWSALSRYDVAILELASGTVRQLTDTDAADAYPSWSPDGSRIAFSRKFFDRRNPEVCTIGVDGAGLHCQAVPFNSAPYLLGWLDARRILLQRDSSGVTLWDVMDAASGERDHLGRSRGARGYLSPDGGWMLVRGAAEGNPDLRWYIFPVDRPTSIRTVTGDVPAEASVLWAQPPTRQAYLSRLIVEPPAAPVPLKAPYKLHAHGATAAGDPFPVHFVTWTSADTSVATVDSAGVVVPKREGRVLVVASAGGWRADTVSLTIAAGRSAPVADESWTAGLESAWVPWGTPIPVVERLSEGRTVLMTRGDSSYDSGVYSRFSVPAKVGFGVEAAVSGALSALQWQRQSLVLLSNPDSAWLAAWDHRTGGLDPPSGDPFYRCWASYPAAEGVAGLDRVSFGCGQLGLTAPTPSALDDGNWHLLRVQVFPDGRLGVAVDGIPFGITTAAARLDRPYRVAISGQSHRAHLLVGDVTVWTGVRDDIDWREVP